MLKYVKGFFLHTHTHTYICIYLYILYTITYLYIYICHAVQRVGKRGTSTDKMFLPNNTNDWPTVWVPRGFAKQPNTLCRLMCRQGMESRISFTFISSSEGRHRSYMNLSAEEQSRSWTNYLYDQVRADVGPRSGPKVSKQMISLLADQAGYIFGQP
jgi:hypothetical protein